jgi:hypothetical protein
MIKRKLLAVALILAMVMGMSTTVFASGEEGGEEEPTSATATQETKAAHDTEHGTKDKALVGETETFATEEGGTNYNGKTQFYIKVDKDATNTEVEIPDPEIVDPPTDNSLGACHYELEWVRHRDANISATVPLYVCMYGYGGTGKVVTPNDDAYYIKNESTYTEYKTISAAYAYYEVEEILNEEDYNTNKEDYDQTYDDYIKGIENYNGGGEEGTFTPIGSLLSEQKSGQYGYYEEDNVRKVVSLSACTYDENKDHYHYKDTSKNVLESVYLDANDDIVSETKDGATKASEKGAIYIAGTADKAANLPLNVPTIKAESYTWKIMPTSTKNLQAGQISMTINNLDLSTVEGANDDNTLDIKDLGWVVPADTNNNILKLPITAAIAGGSVNEEGCAPVVRVTYTVVPAYDSSVINPPPSDESE